MIAGLERSPPALTMTTAAAALAFVGYAWVVLRHRAGFGGRISNERRNERRKLATGKQKTNN